MDVDPRTVIEVLLEKVRALTVETVFQAAQILTLEERKPCGCEGEDNASTVTSRESPGGDQAA